MKTAACYVRVSTQDQTEFSPDAQLKDIERYARQNALQILPGHIYREDGVSGRTAARRTQFQRLMYAAKQKPKPFDVVLIHAYDRFARNVKESRIYKELLRQELGIELIAVTEDFGTGKNAFLLEGIKDVLNEYYSLNLRDEVLKGMKEKAARGGVQTVAAFGYRIENGTFVQIPKEAEHVRAVYQDFIDGLGTFELAKKLNAQGVKTHRGGPMESRTVRYMLQNPVYKGYVRFTPRGAEPIIAKGDFEPIISEEIWNRAQPLLKRRSERRKARPAAEYRDWLSGLVRCPDCGKNMIRSGAYMICGAYAKGACKTRNAIRTETLRAAILDALQKTIAADASVRVTPTLFDKNKEKKNKSRADKKADARGASLSERN